MDTCEVCGGTIIGDGYTMTRHCENVELPNDVEPDAPVIMCKVLTHGDVDVDRRH